MGRLDGRVALVTGGGRGIGRSISELLAAEGATVAVNYRRDADAAAETVAAITAAGGSAKAYAASVDDAVRSGGDGRRRRGRLRLRRPPGGQRRHRVAGTTVADTDPDEMERVVGIHAFGAHHAARLVLPSMRQRPRGDIVMISSVATTHMAANGAPYNMGKAALEALALTLAKEEREHGIHVNVVAPGLVETEMGVRLARAFTGNRDAGRPALARRRVAVRPRVPAGRRRRGRALAVHRRRRLRHRPTHRSRRRRHPPLTDGRARIRADATRAVVVTDRCQRTDASAHRPVSVPNSYRTLARRRCAYADRASGRRCREGVTCRGGRARRRRRPGRRPRRARRPAWLSRFHSRSRIASAGPRSAASPLACSRVTLSPSSSPVDEPFAGDVGAVDVEAAGRELRRARARRVAAAAISKYSSMPSLASSGSIGDGEPTAASASQRWTTVSCAWRRGQTRATWATGNGCHVGPVEVDRRERLDERVGALPEPRRPVGVGIRVDGVAAGGAASSTAWRAQRCTPPRCAARRAQIPARAGGDRGIEGTPFERRGEPVDVGSDVVEVRLGDHDERR